MVIKLSGYNVPEHPIQSEAAFSGPEPTLMGLAGGRTGVSSGRLAKRLRDLPVDALIAFPIRAAIAFTGSPAARRSAISIRSS